MDKKIRLQMIGNYLEPLVEPLREKGILVDSIICGCNPLAMAGKKEESFLHYCEKANASTMLNIKKNLSQMLSRDPKKFTQNYNKLPIGVEIRYCNNTDYIVISNTAAAYTIYKKGELLFSSLWPQNDFIAKIKSDTNYKAEKFPFSSDFNWKYYYDKFIDAILEEYDQDHIILIRVNSADWYMEQDQITAFNGAAALFRNRIEEFDEYFIERTNCLSINTMYSFLPRKKNNGAFAYAAMSRSAYVYVSKCISEIVSGCCGKYKYPLYKGTNSVSKVISKKFSTDILTESKSTFDLIESEIYINKKLNDPKYKNVKLFSELTKLQKFFDKSKNYTISDYYNELSLNSESMAVKMDIGLISIYTKFMKLNLNDIIAIYMLYCRYENKSEFKPIVKNIIENPCCQPVKMAKEFKTQNIEYLKNYPYIQQELLNDTDTDEVYIRLENNCFISLSPYIEYPMNKIHLDVDKKVDYNSIIESGYICSIEYANSLGSNLPFYIEKAKRGDGKTPIKIWFDSIDEFKIYLSSVDFSDLLEIEPFLLSLTGSEYFVTNYKPKTDLSFLFKKGTMICYLSSGLTDQMCYYLASKRAQEIRKGEVYYDDIQIEKNHYYNGSMDELSKIIKEDITKRLFSNLFNKKLISVLASGRKTPDILFKSGCSHLVVVSSEKKRMEGVTICNRLFYTSKESLNDYFSYNFDLTYYLSLIRPEHLMRDSNFLPANYICFPEYDTEKNREIAEKMNDCDAVAIHIRRGDFISAGVIDDMDFYKESLEKLEKLPDYPNKKFFIFSDDIPWCRNNLDEIGFQCFPNADITFIDHNKGSDSYRDMQLMTEAKIHIGGSSGFARMVPILSTKCEVYMQYNLPVMELYKRAGKINKYDIGEYSKPYRTVWPKSHQSAAE